ncbi:MAG: N-acetylmuramoyl-L-alanine amidase [Kiritimatiellia bacterium]|jgi:N-acetylmuramoyl-L-alanine amidase|nr:N-acetylmuramoyl-L-alanine amidase [Kiritimatiellia bacterium]
MIGWRLFLFPLCCLLAASPCRAQAESPYPIAWRGLAQIRDALGTADPHWDGDSLLFSNRQNRVRFFPGRRKAEVNGTTVWLNAPVGGSVAAGDWRLAGTDLDLLQLSLLPPPDADGATQPLLVMLDPGHGGDDNGASCGNPPVREKDLTLAMAKRVGELLKRSGMRVAYTRTRDVTLTLDERVRLARRHRADLFVSLHANHAANTNATGVETYVLPPSGFPGTSEGSPARGWQIGNRNDYHNTLLGFAVHRHLAALTNTVDRGLKRQSFFVLRENGCPAVLLEFGFLSNRDETLLMKTEPWQAARAQAIAAGVLGYARDVTALDRAVAEKRARDAELNERWRRRLAEQSGQARPAPEDTAATAPSLNPNTTNTPDTRVARASGAALAAPILQGTNVAPAELNTLIDFYGAGTVE